MIICWDEEAWDDYCRLQAEDKAAIKKIHALLKDIVRNGYQGIGQDEPLKHIDGGWHSRRIDKKNRLVYRIADARIEIIQCCGHYE